MNIKIIGKYTAGGIATILLGALGSGLWSEFLSPLYDSFITASANGLNYIYSGYLDSIYVRAAKGIGEFYPMKIATLFFSLSLFVVVFYILSKQFILLSDNRVKHISIILIIIAILLIAPQPWIQYSDNARTYALQSIEILRPYVGDEEYHKLRSNFFSMKNTNDFIDLYNSINNLSEKHELSLPEFTPAGT